MYATHDTREKASGDALGHEPLAKPRLLSIVPQALSGPWTVMMHLWCGHGCGYGVVMVRVKRLYSLFSCSGDIESVQET